MAKGSEKKYRRRMSEKDYKKYLFITFTAIALILVLAAGILLYRTCQLKQEEKDYKAQVEKLQSDIDQENERYEELLQKKMEISSDSFIESEARKRLNYIYDGEVLIKSK